MPEEFIIEAHGSFASQRCIDCKAPFDGAEMRDHIKKKKIALCTECGGLVKPDIVFFGESVRCDSSLSAPHAVGLAELC